MNAQKYVVEVNSRIIAAGTLEQCTKLLALVGEMQTVEEKYLSSGYVIYPSEISLEMRRVSGRYTWVDSKAAAEELIQAEKPPKASAEALPL